MQRKIASGVYIVLFDNKIIYIGSSGKMQQNGELKSRKDAIFDRIVNGKQFNGVRNKTWPIEMLNCNFDKIEIQWFVTFDKKHQHIPTYVEALLLQRHFEIYGCLPQWNKKY